MSVRIAAPICGRPGRPVLRKVHFLRTSSRCHRSSVAGATKKATERSRGRTRLAAASRTRNRPQPPWAGRPLQYPELVAENQDLEVLGSVLALLATADEETDEGVGDEVDERPHRPIAPGVSKRESGFPTPTRFTEQMYEAHVNLIRHGREICHARKPDCGHCPVAARCPVRGSEGPLRVRVHSALAGEEHVTVSTGASAPQSVVHRSSPLWK
jgi:Iron-sulfur binding domain of endonuclease III